MLYSFSELLKIQENVYIGEGETLKFTIDLVLYDAETGKALCVLDTKYKINEKPTSDDVAQVVAYAELKDCKNAILIYPITLINPLNESIGSIQVKSMTFLTGGDLEKDGYDFLQCLLDTRINNTFDHALSP